MVSSEQSPGAPVPHSSSHNNIPQQPAPETDERSSDLPENHREAYRSVLDNMIRAAESGDAQVPAAGDGVRQRMVQAARDLGNQPFALTPVVTTLVRAILGDIPAMPAKDSERLITFVATTMFEDAESQLRMRRLWEQLLLSADESSSR
jgi:hypothetical protein